MKSDLIEFLAEVWQHHPAVLIVLVAGFVMFCLLVADTHQVQRRRRERHHLAPPY